MRIVDYKVVRHSNYEIFQVSVLHWIHLRYQLQGGVSVTFVRHTDGDDIVLYAQALILTETEEQ